MESQSLFWKGPWFVFALHITTHLYMNKMLTDASHISPLSIAIYIDFLLCVCCINA